MKLKGLGPSRIMSIVYDNLDFKFKPGQTTLANQSTFESITTGLFFQLGHNVKPGHLRHARLLWESSPLNDRWPSGAMILKDPTYIDIISNLNATSNVKSAMKWHVLSILISTHLPQFKSKLGRPETTHQIPLTKTTCFPMKAMYAKVLTNDGNINAITQLMAQAKIGEDVIQDHVVLLHGDLGVLE
jgi:Family of unknown function (DUF6589)